MAVALVKLFSIFLILFGGLMIVRPEVKKHIFYYVRESNTVYVIGAFRIIVGLVLLFSAAACRVPWVVLIFGALFVITGIVVFMLKKEILMRLLDWIEARPEKGNYILGGTVMLIGVLIVLAA